MAINRFTAGFASLANRIKPVAPAPAAAPATATTASPAHETHHHAEAHHPHGHKGHGPHKAAHGPTPRSRRSTKPRKPRRKSSSGVSMDDDGDLAMPEADANTGVAALAFGDDHRDGGDDQDEGGDERSRHERTSRVRNLVNEKLQGPARDASAAARAASTLSVGHLGLGLGALDPRLALQRYVRTVCLPIDEATAADIQHKKLDLLRATRGAGRPARNEAEPLLAKVKKELVARFPKPQANVTPEEARANQMRPLLLMLSERWRTPSQADGAIATVSVQLRSHALQLRREFPRGAQQAGDPVDLENVRLRGRKKKT